MLFLRERGITILSWYRTTPSEVYRASEYLEYSRRSWFSFHESELADKDVITIDSCGSLKVSVAIWPHEVAVTFSSSLFIAATNTGYIDISRGFAICVCC